MHDSDGQDAITVNGNSEFISITDLLTHRPRFLDTNGEFQIEICISRVQTYYEKKLILHNHLTWDTRNSKKWGNRNNVSSDNYSIGYDSMKVKSEEFLFGGFVWVVVMKPQPPILATSWAATAASAVAFTRQNNSKYPSQNLQAMANSDEFDNLGIQLSLERKPTADFHSDKTHSTNDKDDPTFKKDCIKSTSSVKNCTSGFKRKLSSSTDNWDVPNTSRDKLLAQLSFKVWHVSVIVCWLV